MPADIILEEQSVNVTDGVLICTNDNPLQASFRGANNTRVDVKSGEIQIQGRNQDGNTTTVVLSPSMLGYVDKVRSGKVSAEELEANEIQVGRGTSGEPGSHGMISVEDGQGGAKIRLDGKNGNMRLGDDGADGDVWLRDQNGKNTIELDAGSGGRKFRSTRILLDGKRGDIKLSGEVSNLSDARCKENVEPIDEALEKVMALQGVTFNWKDAEGCPEGIGDRRIGLIAQRVKEVLPEAVSEDESGLHSITYAAMVPVLIEALKEQQRLIEGQADKLNALSKRLDALEATPNLSV